MITFLPEPYHVTWDNHNDTKGKPFLMIGFQLYGDNSIHPILIDESDGRIMVSGLYNVQVDLSKILPGAKRQIPVPRSAIRE